METRSKKGEKYPCRTLNLLSGIKHYMQSLNPHYVNFLDQNNPDFSGLRGVQDSIAQELQKEGIGVSVEGITHEEEQLLWQNEMLGYVTLTSLLNAVFFNNGKVLMLRGGTEHWQLKLSQFKFGEELRHGELVRYCENCSKNYSGSYREKGENKVVKQYADVSLGERCYYYMIKFYVSKFPVSYNGDAFYLRPRTAKPKNAKDP